MDTKFNRNEILEHQFQTHPSKARGCDLYSKQLNSLGSCTSKYISSVAINNLEWWNECCIQLGLTYFRILDFGMLHLFSLESKLNKMDEDGLVPKDMIASSLLQSFKSIEDPNVLFSYIEYYEEYSTLLIISTDQVHKSSCISNI